MLARMAPMIAPIFANLQVRVHHFYCSQRNIWNAYNEERAEAGDPTSTYFDWEKFITGEPKRYGSDTPPGLSFTEANHEKSIYDCLGLQKPAVGNDMSVNAGPVIMHNMIWNHFYADQDLVDVGASGIGGLTYKFRNPISWEKDYFTTARPWPTHDGENTTIPMGTKNATGQIESQWRNSVNGAAANAGAVTTDANGLLYEDANRIYPEMDVQLFRRALALNQWSELQAKYGKRYVEYMRYYLHSQMPMDSEQPIYLGGGNATMNISEVVQTAPETDQTSPTEYGVGDLYGHGISASKSNEFMATFDEHGYIMTILSVRPKVSYNNGVPKLWLKSDRLDYYDPLLNNIGMAPIMNAEVFAEGDVAATTTWPDIKEDGTWGWQDRYEEYRQQLGIIGNDFKDVLDYWTMARNFTALPNLNYSYLHIDDDAVERAFNLTNTDQVWLNVQNNFKAKRIVQRSSRSRTI